MTYKLQLKSWQIRKRWSTIYNLCGQVSFLLSSIWQLNSFHNKSNAISNWKCLHLNEDKFSFNSQRMLHVKFELEKERGYWITFYQTLIWMIFYSKLNSYGNILITLRDFSRILNTIDSSISLVFAQNPKVISRCILVRLPSDKAVSK